MEDDKASRIGWGALLAGDAFDLDDWQDALKHPFDPWVTAAEARLILRSSRLDGEATPDTAYKRAKTLMNEVNGAMRARYGTWAVRLDGIAEIFSDGTHQPQVVGELGVMERPDKVKIGDRLVADVFGPDGKPKPDPAPRPSDPQRWLSIAAEDDLLGDALVYFARGDDWFDVYKALECLFGRFGGERKFLALGWADEDKIKLLKQTADTERRSRRGRPKVVPPDHPMERTEARDLLAKLMARAFLEAPTTPPPSP
jgi:hypothetical protein